MRWGRIILCLTALLIAASLAACQPAPTSQASYELARASFDTTIGPVAVDETVTVGPFEVSIRNVRFIEDPQTGRDMAVAGPLPPGRVLARAELRFVLGDGEHDDLAPSQTFELVDDGGVVQLDLGFSIGRTRKPSSGVEVNWVSYAPLEPGEVFRLTPKFSVDPKTEHLTLRYWPYGKQAAPAEFVVK